jgi:hypothetical protein
MVLRYYVLLNPDLKKFSLDKGDLTWHYIHNGKSVRMQTLFSNALNYDWFIQSIFISNPLLTRVCWKSFSVGVGGWGLGCGGWGVGFYPFSGGQLPNFQGKSPWIFPPITPRVGTFWGQKSLKTLLDKVFRFIQQTLTSFLITVHQMITSTTVDGAALLGFTKSWFEKIFSWQRRLDMTLYS